ncbi:MAG: translational GTPase TypA [Clostridia bacterium]
MKTNENIRNIAIIAHVDHGKTTLVDVLLRQSGIFRANQALTERVMDSNDLERERGITIYSKNASVRYKDTKINIIDTPGHADFGGEVERVLKMVEGVLLLVDAFEGPMPQTRFVLRKALELDLVPIVVINKVDRVDSRAEQVHDEIIDLFISLNIEDHQLDFPILFVSAKEGYAIRKLGETPVSVQPLLEAIIHSIPPPSGDSAGPFQCPISSIDYDKYVGRIGIGKITRGKAREGMDVSVCKKNSDREISRISQLYTFAGMKKEEALEAGCGDIVAVSGLMGINIGDTICHLDHPDPVSFVDIDEPTISMIFSVNNSPFAGTEGTFVTSRHLRERLFRELENNVSLHIEETSSTDSFKVLGRGELHLSILIETMRREGYEFQVSRPVVVIKEIDGEKHEPLEYLIIDVADEFVGTVMKKIGARKGELLTMEQGMQGSTRLEFSIPAKNLIGYYSEMLTDTRGTAVMNHTFDRFAPYRHEVIKRPRGSMIAYETGEAITYGLFYAQKRGTLFIDAKTKVYEGMIVGENAKAEDLNINVCKKKHLTGMRASGSEEARDIVNIRTLSLEQCIEFIADDELVEITPKTIRMRKKELSMQKRNRLP